MGRYCQRSISLIFNTYLSLFIYHSLYIYRLSSFLSFSLSLSHSFYLSLSLLLCLSVNLFFYCLPALFPLSSCIVSIVFLHRFYCLPALFIFFIALFILSSCIGSIVLLHCLYCHPLLCLLFSCIDNRWVEEDNVKTIVITRNPKDILVDMYDVYKSTPGK